MYRMKLRFVRIKETGEADGLAIGEMHAYYGADVDMRLLSQSYKFLVKMKDFTQIFLKIV